MATEIVAPTPRGFLTLNGKYQIAPSTTVPEMVNDAGCLLEAADATIGTVMDALEEQDGNLIANPQQLAKMLYGVQYQLQMVRNLVWAMDPGAQS